MGGEEDLMVVQVLRFEVGESAGRGLGQSEGVVWICVDLEQQG